MKDEINLSLLPVGHPVRLRDGRTGTYKGPDEHSKRYPQIVEVEGYLHGYTNRGSFYESVGQHANDIVSV